MIIANPPLRANTVVLEKPAVNPVNNLDLIRLFAALQVAIYHIARHLNLDAPWLEWLSFFPGVPIFFFISGFLIYQSYVNANKTGGRTFFVNRVLRLYPALYVCFFVTLLSVYLSGYLQTQQFTWAEFLFWVGSALTFFQFFSPDFLRAYGSGSINGSLWSVSVELQFYMLTPLIYLCFHKYRAKGFFMLAILFVAINIANTTLNPGDTVAWKLLGGSFLPWLYMFLLGAYVSTNKQLQQWVMSINWYVLVGAYVAAYALAFAYGLGISNRINFISFTLLAFLVLKLAYTKPHLSGKLLGSNDVSYGIYIYHMPVVNFLLYQNAGANLSSFFLAFTLTVLFALASWFLVEKPALKFKLLTLRNY